MLRGYDLSSNNSTADEAKALLADFVIVKATQGYTYFNPRHDPVCASARARGTLLGHYHFAMAANDPVREANWFVLKSGALPGEVLVLDFEPYGQGVPDAGFATWVVAFLRRVKELTGADAWIYLNDDMANRVFAVATKEQAAYIRQRPLWKAAYQATLPTDTEGWPAIDVWQHTDTPIDTDIFYGDAARFRALGIPQEDDLPTTDDMLKALRADFNKVAQEPDGSWPLGAILRTRVNEEVGNVLRAPEFGAARNAAIAQAASGPVLTALATLPAQVVTGLKAWFTR